MNYKLPAEYHLQKEILISLPKLSKSWYSDMPSVENTLLSITDYISKSGQCVILTSCETERIQNILKTKFHNNFANIQFLDYEVDDIWVRDYGVLSLADNSDESRVIYKYCDFQFNGWGGKFPADLDNQFNIKLIECLNQKSEQYNYILEGGAIESDGNGLSLTTSQVLFNNNRNSQYTNEENINKLKEYLHINQLVIFDHGYLEGDDTDGHIDTLVRFAPDNHIIYTNTGNAGFVKEVHDKLLAINKNYKFVELPLPEKKLYCLDSGENLPMNYTNFLITNKLVLVPIYNDSQDNYALESIQKVFKSRKVIGINCEALIHGRGVIHCATMQLY